MNSTPATSRPDPGDAADLPPLVEFDVAGLRALLDGDHAAIRNRVRAALPELSAIIGDPSGYARDEYCERVWTATRRVADLRLMADGFPAEYGGNDDVASAVAAFETLGFGDLSVLVKVGVQFGLFGGALTQLGTRSHHEAYLADVVTARLPGCFAMTETGHGSDVQSLETTAEYEPETETFVIDTPHPLARKDYIGNAGRHGRLAVVFARLRSGGTDHGVHAFVVAIRDRSGATLPGVTLTDCGPKMGLNGVDNGRITFTGVRVARHALLDRFATVQPDGTYQSPIASDNKRFFTTVGTLVQGRASVAGASLSAAKVALTVAVRYGLVRRQFSPAAGAIETPLLDYGLHQRRLLPLLARTYALSAAQQVLLERLQERFTGDCDDVTARQLESRAAGTKALASWHATRTIQECREACGGAGYLSVNGFDRLKADTDIFATFEGDNHVLLQLVGKGLLTDYRSDFADLDRIATARFVASQAVEAIVERSNAHRLLERLRDLLPGEDAWDAETGLLDPRYQLAMFEFRETHQLTGLARRLRGRLQAGEDPGQVFSRVQPHLVTLSRSHVERLALQAISGLEQAMPAGPTRAALALLTDLYALSTIEADRAWFMEHGRLGPSRARAITREVDDLCRRVRPLAGQLCDAFGVPEHVLDVEMIRDNTR